MIRQRLATVAMGVAGALALSLVGTPVVSAPDLGIGATDSAVRRTLPRVAFTDARDGLRGIRVVEELDREEETFTFSGENTGPLGTVTSHEGEASYRPFNPNFESASLSFVSTRPQEDSAEDPDGEVYADTQFDNPSPADAEAVTCDNRARETHPVVSPDGDRVAYATNASGNWDIWVATPADSVMDKSPGDTTCAGWLGVRVTDHQADDLWPAWAPDGDRLVFSSTRHDPLGDLYVIDSHTEDIWYDQRTAPAIPDALRLTNDPGADTQPSVSAVPPLTGVPVVAFTTTRFRTDGSIGLLPLPSPTSQEVPQTVSAWRGNPPQSSEPAWLSTSHLAFSSTALDSYGDVWVAVMSSSVPGHLTDVFSADPVADVPGVTESHGTWRQGFQEESGVVVAHLAVTVRSTDADIADVRTDGSRHRTVASHRDAGGEVDERGAAYSPDGTRVVYSRQVRSSERREGGRALVVAAADGAGARMLPAGRRVGDVDLDPVWSPDGKRIAFTRFREPPQETRVGAVWVVTLATGQARPVSAPPRATDTQTSHDENPSWSADSSRLVFARRTVTTPPPSEPFEQPTATSALWVVDAGGGSAIQLERRQPGCEIDCAVTPVQGRSPAWSPNGARIVYERRGALHLATLRDNGTPGPEVPERVVRTVAVTGFQATMVPTPSRSALSAAHDPAWSPDGQVIGFIGQPAGRPDDPGVYTIRPDGSGLRQLAQRPGPETDPAMQPWADLAVSLDLDPAAIEVAKTAALTVTVTNEGPASSAAPPMVTVSLPRGLSALERGGCEAMRSGVACPMPMPIDADDTAGIDISLRAATPGIHTLTAATTSGTPDPRPKNNTGSTSVEVVGDEAPVVAADVAVTVALGEELGWVGGQTLVVVTVANAGPSPATDVEVTTSYPRIAPPSMQLGCAAVGSACSLGTVQPGETRTLVTLLRFRARGVGSVGANVVTTTTDPVPANNTASADLNILRPRLRLLPAVSQPGYATIAFGEDMPPGARVRLTWSRGINTNPGPFTVEPDGTLSVPIFILRQDALGERRLVARSLDGRFSPVGARMLVVARTVTAPNFVDRG